MPLPLSCSRAPLLAFANQKDRLITMQIDIHNTVYKNPAFYCGPGPSVVCDPDNGYLTVVFRRVKSWLDDGLAGHWHPGTETCITHSDDLGQTWSPPRILFSGWQCPCLTRLSDGTLLHSSHRFEIVSPQIRSGFADVRGVMTDPWPGLHAGTACHRSTDGGQTWSEPVWLTGVPGIEPFHKTLEVPIALRGNILELRDGRLVVSAYGFEGENTTYLFEFADQGRSWTFQSTIASGFNETYLHEASNGNLIALMRPGETESRTFTFLIPQMVARRGRSRRLYVWAILRVALRLDPETC
jgi:hypothetical protein